MAPHSSTLAWKIPWMEEPGRLQSMGSQRTAHDWATSLSLFTFMHWRRKWQPTPVFLSGESQGGEPGGLLSMGSHRVGHDWRDLAAAAASLLLPIMLFQKLFILYWSIVDLQCCIAFRCTENWFRYRYILFQLLFPFSLFHLFLFHLDYRVEFPVLYSRSLSVIYFK